MAVTFSTARSPGQQAGPIYLASLDSAERKLLLNADSTNVLYTQGHLLFLRETTLMAQPFDARRLVLTGDAFPIAEQIQTQGVFAVRALLSVREWSVGVSNGTRSGGLPARVV